MKFTEAKLEAVFVQQLEQQGYRHVEGSSLEREPSDVLLKDDLRSFLMRRYAGEGLTKSEADSVIRQLEAYSAADLYESNKAIMRMVRDGLLLKREDRSQKDLYLQLIDYDDLGEALAPDPDFLHSMAADEGTPFASDANTYKFVTQLEIVGDQKRIPDGILYINGIPLVVFEFKSAIREEATLHDAFVQLTVRYRRDIPALLKYNAFCVISDGVNNKAGAIFSEYEFFYAWRRLSMNLGSQNDKSIEEGSAFQSLFTMVEGMLNPFRLKDILHNFIFLPDTSKKETKIVARYPQYFAARKLFEHIKTHQKPEGDGKGGTYFGATGCGKSFTMLFLARLLMRSKHFGSPTIVLITDRTDLDEQLSAQFTAAKAFIGDQNIASVGSRAELRELLQGRNSGGVFLTTIHKFTEDTQLLTERNNVICISDEAHRSQTNLDQKVRMSAKGVTRTYGFAKHLHDSLPNATYVGFTGTPIDATLDVFGEIVDAYTMTESVADQITVRIVYEGRAAKVLLDNSKLEEIEAYYASCAEEGANDYQIEESKKKMAQMSVILGDPNRLKAIAADFVQHYEARITEGATVMGKAMFVCSSREIAYALYQEIIALRPSWAEEKIADDEALLSEKERKKIKPMPRVKMIMTRGKDDPKALYDMLGTKEYRKELDRQFKNEKSNFKIAIVVDMWLTGFDVPFLDTMYIDKPVQRHSLIQTISRVNRTFAGKEKGLVVDYIGIKRQMNLALAMFGATDRDNFEDIEASVIVVRDHLDLLGKLMHKFDAQAYFSGTAMQQLETLNLAAEFVQMTRDKETRFMQLVKRLKAAYDICAGSSAFDDQVRDRIHFYFAVRSIVFKLNKGDAPDTAQMNAKVRQMIIDALESDGVQEIFKLDSQQKEVDLFDPDYLAKIDKIKLPNTKIKLLQQLLKRTIGAYSQINRLQGLDFSKRFKELIDKYNERKEGDTLQSVVLEEFSDEIIELYHAILTSRDSHQDLGIDFEEKAFYDILKSLAVKYDFVYPEDKLIVLSREVKVEVEDKSKYTDWNKREDIKAALKVGLIILLAKHGYPPVDRDEVYQEIFEQAENFKKGTGK